MKIFIILLVLSLTVNYGYSAEKIICNKEGELNLDINFQKMYLFGSPDRTYPTSDTEMESFCKEDVELQNKIKNYSNKCLSNLAKQVVNLLMYSLAKNNNNMCKSQKRKRAFLKLGNCGNAVKTDTMKCFNNLTAALDGVSYYPNDGLKIPLVCCNFFRMKSCNLKAYEKRSSPRKCSQKESEGLDNLLNVYAIQVLRLLCGDYNDENDKCDSIIGETPKSNLTPLPKSPISIFVKIFETFPEV